MRMGRREQHQLSSGSQGGTDPQLSSGPAPAGRAGAKHHNKQTNMEVEGTTDTGQGYVLITSISFSTLLLEIYKAYLDITLRIKLAFYIQSVLK